MTCSAATQTIVDGNTVRIRGRIVGRDPTALITTASIQGANLTRYLVNLTTGAVVNTATLDKTAVILNAPLSGEGWDTDLGASYNLDDTITGTLLAVTTTTSMQVVYEWIDAAGHQVRLKTDPFTVSNLVV